MPRQLRLHNMIISPINNTRNHECFYAMSWDVWIGSEGVRVLLDNISSTVCKERTRDRDLTVFANAGMIAMWCSQSQNHWLAKHWSLLLNSLSPTDTVWRYRSESTSPHTIIYYSKLFRQPALTNHQWDVVAFTWEQFHKNDTRYLSLVWLWADFTDLRSQPHLSRANELLSTFHALGELHICEQ